MSAGNYGKAFAFVTSTLDTPPDDDVIGQPGGEQKTVGDDDKRRPKIGKRLVVMPVSAPADRQQVIEVLQELS